MNIACNILVIRKDNKRREVLLAERVGGEFGRHKLAAPGGTVKLSDNSVFSTAQRELREETNLVAESMSDISPTSIKYTNYSGKPEYLSIGFFARFEELGGKLIGRESDLGEWKWYDINKVPDDIFDPTLTALNDFLDGKYKELTWSHVESEADKFKARGRTNGQNDRGDEDNSLFD
jgi:8-oxo-dGTP pyrophosphatase MutT (NUDIX family)